jgi:uncharacterized protein YegJ (DUF2314 family)
MLLAAIVGLGLAVWAFYTTDDWEYLGMVVPVLFFLGSGRRLVFPGEPPPLAVDPGDPLMRQAIADARREVGGFVNGMRDGKKEPFVKFALRTIDGGAEHVWAVAHSIEHKLVVVSVVSEPVGPIEVDSARQKVRLDEIEDWMLVDTGGDIEGGYTQIAMARIYKRDKGYVPYAVRKSLEKFSANAQVFW